MFGKLLPQEDYASTYDIDFASYYKQGYRGVLFDIDNTLVEHDQPATPRAIMLFEELRAMGMQACAISNNKDYRVRPFADAVGIPYVYKAGKPSAKGYRKGMEIMGTTPETTLFVGDQLFTDVWGANRAGLHSILVGQIAKHEEIQIVLKRRLEAVVLLEYKYKKKNKK